MMGLKVQQVQTILSLHMRRRFNIGCSNSDWSDILSGVPLGNVLGPRLFLIYINDPQLSCVKLFSNDTKLYRVVPTHQDRHALQNDLQRVMQGRRHKLRWALPTMSSQTICPL